MSETNGLAEVSGVARKPTPLTLDEAKQLIASPEPFGDVFPLIDPLDHAALKHWFATTRGVRPNEHPYRPPDHWSGNLCKCGGPMVRTGACETCQHCGQSSGGCG